MRTRRRVSTLGSLLVAMIAACASSGCSSPVAYKPSRGIVRSIPPDAAQAALRDLLGKATSPGPLRNIQVDIDAFGFTCSDPWGAGELSKRYPYADVAPHIYQRMDHFFVCITGPLQGVVINVSNDCLFFAPGNFDDAAESAEKFCDALESLRAHASRPPSAKADR